MPIPMLASAAVFTAMAWQDDDGKPLGYAFPPGAPPQSVRAGCARVLLARLFGSAPTGSSPCAARATRQGPREPSPEGELNRASLEPPQLSSTRPLLSTPARQEGDRTPDRSMLNLLPPHPVRISGGSADPLNQPRNKFPKKVSRFKNLVHRSLVVAGGRPHTGCGIEVGEEVKNGLGRRPRLRSDRKYVNSCRRGLADAHDAWAAEVGGISKCEGRNSTNCSFDTHGARGCRHGARPAD